MSDKTEEQYASLLSEIRNLNNRLTALEDRQNAFQRAVEARFSALTAGQDDPLQRLEADAFVERYPTPGGVGAQAVPGNVSFDGRGVRRRVNSRYFNGD